MSKEGPKAVNKKAKKLEEREVFGMMDVSMSMPIGCTTIFDTGWETNLVPSRPIGNCVSSARDFPGCAIACWWPAQNPDGITQFPDYHNQCQLIARDWRNLNYVIKR